MMDLPAIGTTTVNTLHLEVGILRSRSLKRSNEFSSSCVIISINTVMLLGD
jgi:hypothetical protein